MKKKLKYVLLIIVLLVLFAACENNKVATSIKVKNQITHEDSMVVNETTETADETPEWKMPGEKTPYVTVESSLNTEEIENFKKYYSLSLDKDENYIIKLFDNEGKLVDDLTNPKEPSIHLLTNNVMQIIIYYGSPFYYTYFYNIENGNISQAYDTPVLAKGNKIVYIDRKKLIVKDIFDEEKYYKEIERNFTETVPPSSAISKANFISDHELKINYYEGKNYNKKKETLDLDKY